MMKIKSFLLASFAILAVGCTADFNEAVTLRDKEIDEMFAQENVAKNVLNVKFSRQTADELSVSETRSGELTTGNLTLDDICREYEVVSMERLFPVNEYEKRTRKMGLDQWYEVRVGGRKTASATAKRLHKMEGVIAVSPQVKVKRANVGEVHYLSVEDAERLQSSRAESSGYTFNDPLLPEQWMLKNVGNESDWYGEYNFVAGADINVEGAWAVCGGSNEVIVSVVDGGIEYTHPDLAANMWEGVGYNFVTNSKTVTGEEHGTHVAGTIAAVNNNGKGVCGIAGGTGLGDGVKLMSCQIFTANDSAYDNDVAKAIKFGADNGAVISQNSWGYDIKDVSTEAQFASKFTVIKDAIDYFVKYAGMDAEGETQVGPMAGGVVIFAAGNDEREQSEFPASYSKCLSVAAMSGNFRRAWYSTYSTAVDLFAPGGDGHTYDQVGADPSWNLSTLPLTIKNGDILEEDGYKYIIDYVRTSGYGYMRGTSMACPHVSGAAALIVSYCGGEGFTNTRLTELLLNSAKNVDSYQTNSFKGKVGKLIDVTAALEMGGPGDGYEPINNPRIALIEGEPMFYLLPAEKSTLVCGVYNFDTFEVSDKRVETLLTDDKLTLSIDASLFEEGLHKVVVKVRKEDKEASLSFAFEIVPISAKFYPNPCEDVLNVQMNKIKGDYRNCEARLSIANSLGVTIFDQTVYFKKNRPEELIVKALNPGRYQLTMVVEYGGARQTIKQTVIKK